MLGQSSHTHPVQIVHNYLQQKLLSGSPHPYSGPGALVDCPPLAAAQHHLK